MLKEKRRQQIQQLLVKNGSVQTRELCKLFQVSDMTIRRDLDYLCAMQNVLRTHGGAIYTKSEERRLPVNPAGSEP